jgi:hypothetical protein
LDEGEAYLGVRTESVDDAVLLPAQPHQLLRTSVMLSLGRVADAWDWRRALRGRGAWRGVVTSAWVARSLGRSAQALVWVPAWSVGTEGSERGRLLVALARRPPALGQAIRVVPGLRPAEVRVGWNVTRTSKPTRSPRCWCGASGGHIFTTKRPGPTRAPAGAGTGPDPAAKWRSRNGPRPRRHSSVTARAARVSGASAAGRGGDP